MIPLLGKHEVETGTVFFFNNYFQVTSGFNPSCPETYIVLSAITAWLEKKGQLISKNKIYRGHSIFEATLTPKGGINLINSLF